MFPYTTGQQDVLSAARYRVDLRVEVANANGTYKNLSALPFDWVDSVAWGWDLDRPVPEARIVLRRDVTDGRSLAPLDQASTLNVDDAGSTAALIDAGRALRIYTGTYHSTGTAPSSSDLQLMFMGEIDEVGWGQPQVEIVGRSQLMSHLADRWTEAKTIYGASSGDAVETVIQQILDDWTDLGTSLWVPTVPGFLVTEYEQQQMPVLQAVQALAQLPGWDVRERWSSSGGAFALKFYEPDRSPTSSEAQWTFGSSGYYDVRRLTISRDDIRNVVSVSYSASSDRQRNTSTVQSTSSQDRWGRRWMQIEEPAESPIDSAAEAITFATAALSDLKDPAAEQEIELPYFWPAEVQDYYGFTANGIHYSVDQYFGVYGVRHELSRDKHRTIIQARGKPAGQYIGWHTNNPTYRPRDPVEESRDNRFRNFRRVVDNNANTVTFYWSWGGSQNEAWIHNELVTEPEVVDTFNNFASEAPDTILVRGTDDAKYEVAFPVAGKVRLLQFEPRDANLRRGPVIRIVVDPQPIQQASDLPAGSIIASQLIKSAQRFGSDINFTPSDYNTLAWSSGTITMSDDTQYIVNSGNTGDMSTALHYLYFDKDVSTSAIQVSTSSTSMSGNDRLLMCVSFASTSTDQDPFYVPAVGVLGLNEGQLSANIVASNILKSNTITAALINVAQLSAISADMGTVTAGTVSANVIVAAEQFTAAYAFFRNSARVTGYIQGGVSSSEAAIGRHEFRDLVRFSSGGAVQLYDGRILEFYNNTPAFGGDIRAWVDSTGDVVIRINGNVLFDDKTSWEFPTSRLKFVDAASSGGAGAYVEVVVNGSTYYMRLSTAS